MNRYGKRIFSVIMAFIMVAISFCVFAGPEPVYAANKKGLSRSSAVMKTGGTIKLTVRRPGKRVKWTTTDKSVAYVKTTKGKYRQTAVIKAGKNPGECTITAVYGKKKQRCRITVRQNSPKQDYKLVLSGSTKDLSASVPAETAAEKQYDDRFIGAAADFSFDILEKTIETDAEKGISGNTLVSPDSILTALVMAENGAQGETLKEMQDVLSGGISVQDYNGYLSGLNNRLAASEDISYHVANSIWTCDGGAEVKKTFLQVNKTYHNAEVYRAAFNGDTIKDINNWVRCNTRGMINKIIDRISPEDQVVLINAIAFEGSWEEKFPDPQKEDFTPEGGASMKVDMLHQHDHMPYIEINGGKGFVKNYYGGDISFVGLLPPEGMSVDEYLSGITGSKFVSAWGNKKSKNLDIKLPQFKYDYSASMKDPLEKMGMKKAFTPSADFTEMCAPYAGGPIYIGDVLHKTHIELDKNGTKAAAVTSVVMKAGSMPAQEPVTIVHLDRPFVYALVDTKTGIPLFIGIYRNTN